ncbi:putative ribonuclease H-like domain-containing protein, partial [Tanacetum coccineum]
MQDELLQFSLQKVWRLVDLPKDKHAIGTKWVYRNKKDERGIVVRNKARLVEKALYSLHQAPKAWYETLSTYLLENGFRRENIDKTLFIKKNQGDILLVQVYVDDIIFGSTKKSLCIEFESLMHKKFQMSSMRELTFFLGLQVMQRDDGIFISQDKYVADILKKFDFVIIKIANTLIKTNKAFLKDKEAKDVDVHLYRSMIGSLMYLTASRPDIMFAVCTCARFQVTPKVLHLHVVKRIFRYLKGQPKLGLWYPRDSLFDLESFSDSDYVGASLDRKSTIGAEYVAAANWCGQEDRMEMAATTASSLEAEQDSVNVAQLKLNAAKLKLVLLGLIYLINPTIYTTCIEQFWTSAKAKTVNGEHQIQALVDKKKVIITETSIRSNLKLDDVEGTDCLPTATIFAELERMGYENLTQKLTFYKAYFSSQWEFLIHTILQCLSAKTTSWNEFSSTMASAIICLATNKNFNFSNYIFDNMVKNLEGRVKFLMYPRFVQVFLDKQVEGMSRHKGIYVIPSHTKKVFANMKGPGKGFSRKFIPLFETMMVQATKDMGEDSTAPTDSHSTPIHTQPSSSKPQKKKSRRKQRNDSGPTKPIHDEAINEVHVATPSCDPPQSGEDIIRVKSLEKIRKSRTPGFKRLRKVGSVSRVISFNDVSLGAQEDASKPGRKIPDLNADAEVTLVDETKEMNDDNLMFDKGVLEEQEKEVTEKEVSVADPVTTADEVVTTANVEVTTANAPTKTIDELTLAQTLIEIKAAKPKAVTTTTTIRLKAKGVVVQEP